MFRRIIVGLDGSEKARKGARIGFELANVFAGEVTLMHVPQAETAHYFIDMLEGDVELPRTPSFEVLEEAGRHVLDQALKVAADLRFKRVVTHMPHGEAATEILEHAEQIGADLIITGRRGLSPVSSLLLGSTTLKINRLAKCACLSVV